MFNQFLKFAMTFSMMVFSLQSPAMNEVKLDPQFVAKTSAEMMNRYATIGELLNDLKEFYGAAEIKAIEDKLIAVGVKLDQPLPKVKAIGAQVVMSGERFSVLPEGKIKHSGKITKVTGKPLDAIFQEILGEVKKTAAFPFSIISEAYAAPVMALATIVALGGIVVAVVVAGVAIGYMSKSAWESLKDGKTECTPDGKFKLRKKTTGNFAIASNEEFILNLQAASAIAERPINKCDEQAIKDVALKAKQKTLKEIELEKEKSEGAVVR